MSEEVISASSQRSMPQAEQAAGERYGLSAAVPKLPYAGDFTAATLHDHIWKITVTQILGSCFHEDKGQRASGKIRAQWTEGPRAGHVTQSPVAHPQLSKEVFL